MRKEFRKEGALCGGEDVLNILLKCSETRK
jgi:hypothetical protein